MKFEIVRRDTGRVYARVVDDGTTRALRHRVRHSPTGFEFGYGGSGPADLARSIVAEVQGTDDPNPREYMAVKWALIANVPRETREFTITEEQVEEVIAATASKEE